MDALVRESAARLSPPVALVALGAYGRKQLTPKSDVELLFLHDSTLSTPELTQTVCYPLWEQSVRVEPLLRTLDECARDLRRSWSTASRYLDARRVGGDPVLFQALDARLQALRHDTDGLRHRVRADTAHRYATHPPVTASSTPDVVAGRGGLLDIQALHWLDADADARTRAALNFLLALCDRAEEIAGQPTQRLSSRLLERLEADDPVLEALYAHARWVAFQLDGALTVRRDDRKLGPVLSLRDNQLVADRPPPLERAPSLGLRVANLAGLAPPSADLLDWACHASSGPPLAWDESVLDQFWLLLRAADWRAWEFLDVSGLLLRFVPEFQAIWRRRGSASTGEQAADTHSFEALRRLHEATEADDPLVRRAWRVVRQRDPVYLAVLLHELGSESASEIVNRLSLPDVVRDAVTFGVATYQSLLDTATRRDLHDEELVLELATRIGNRQRLGMLFLVAAAHEMAAGPSAWSPWKADLVRQLFGYLEVALRQPAEVGARRTRSLEQHRERIVRALQRRNLYRLAPLVARLPRRYVLTRSPALAAQHLSLLASGPLQEGEVRIQASRQRQPGLWDLLVVARDRPGLLAMVAGVLALRGASVLAADAATSSDGLVLDVFTVGSADALQWPLIEADLQAALLGRVPLHDLLGSRAILPDEAAATHVAIDNEASQFFNLVEVRAPDQVGLLYRIASALRAEEVDIHHARIATHPEGALDVFYVRDLNGQKLGPDASAHLADSLTARLRTG